MTNNIKLVIENFKGVLKAEIDLPKVSILIGGNNSGKTTLLEALYLLSGPCNTTPYVVNDRIACVLEVLNYLHAGPTTSDYSFLIYKYVANNVRIYGKFEEKEYELRIYNTGDSLIFYTPLSKAFIQVHCVAKNISGEIRPYPDTRKELPPGISSWTSEERIKLPKALYIHPSLCKPAWKYFIKSWSRMVSITPHVASYLQGLTREEVQNITLEPFTGGELTLYAMIRTGERIRLSDMGDGIQALATLMILYEHVKPKLLLIDDVESHLNPRALKILAQWLLKVIEEDNIYFIASTHSLETAKLLTTTLEELGARIILLDLRDGILYNRELTIDEVEKLEKSGIDPRLAEALLI